MNELKSNGNMFRLMKKHPFIYIMTFGACAAGAVAYWYTSEPSYRSSVIIEKPASQTNEVHINLPWDRNSATTEELTSVNFLKEAITEKPSLLQSYYIKTDYRKEETRYRFPYQITHRVIGNPDFSIQNYRIEPVNDNIYKLTAIYNGVSRTLQGEFGKELIENNIALTISQKETSAPAEQYHIKSPEYFFSIESPAGMAERLLTEQGRIDAVEINGVISINCEEGHPDKAQELASTIANHLIGEQNSGNEESIPGNTQTASIDKKLEQVSGSLSKTEDEIVAYKKANRITDLDTDIETAMAVVKDLQLQKTDLEMQLATLDNMSNYLRKNIDGNNARVEYGTINDPEFTAQITRLNEIYRDNGEAASVSKEVQQLKASIAERILNTRKKTTIQLEGINLALQNKQRNLAVAPEQAAALVGLERKLAVDKKVYDLLIEKRAQAIVNGAIAVNTGGRIVKPATLPTAPAAPLWWLTAMIALLAGSTLSWLFSYLIEARKSKKVNVEPANTQETKIPFIGYLKADSDVPGENEEINAICTKIMMIPETKLITVTSASEAEGKTTTAITLAQNLAAIDKKVLLIDMNLYQPTVGRELNIAFNHTLADVLEGSCDVHDAIAITSRPNLEVMSAGNMIMGINTWLSSSKKESIINTLKQHYDYIIIDTPGVSRHIDALPMIRISDITLFVVRANSSRKDSIMVAENLQLTSPIENLFYVLTPEAGSGSVRNRRTRERKINITKTTIEKPTLLKRIALWFY
jgi:capsular exopolysaccharide synthesis family protein